MQVTIKARGNLSARDKDSLVKEVEQRLLQLNDDIRIIYARSGTSGSGSEDSIGLINLELADWKYRNKADKIKQIIREKTKDLYGITIEVSEEEQGPPSGKAIDVQISGANDTIIHNTAKLFVDALKADNDFVDIEDSLPIDAIEWHIKVDREKAAIFGVNIGLVGSFIKMVTNGMMLGKYRPDDNDDEVDVILRFPEENRNLSYLDKLRIISNNGSVPISNFVTREAHRKSGQILRVGGKRVMEVKADVKPGVVADQKIQLMKDWIGNQKFHPSVEIEFKGQEEQQNDSKEFLSNAFILALFAMILILALQFNDLYIVFVIMTAVFLSTVGVILGLLITNQPFGIVMCGVGIIALSGTVVNNNIIFIDTFEQIKDKGVPLKETLIRTGAQRIRPILLTAGTGVLGLMPMVLGMNIDFFAREITIGAPSSQWWRQISTTISGGLAFATILTLFFTPALMVVGDEFAKLNLRSKLIRLFISISSNVKQKLAKYI